MNLLVLPFLYNKCCSPANCLMHKVSFKVGKDGDQGERKKSKKVKRLNVLAHPCWSWYAEKILLEFFLILLCLLALDRDLLLTTRGSDPLLILHLLRITQIKCLKVSACGYDQTLRASSPHWAGVVGLPAAEPKLHRNISCSH